MWGDSVAHLRQGMAETGVRVVEYTMREMGTASPATVVPVRWATERGRRMATAKKPAAKKPAAKKSTTAKKSGGAKKR